MYTVFSSSHWLPCNDRPSDRAFFTMHLIAPASLTVIASGEFVSARTGKGETISTWRVQHPISTYVAGFAMGRFDTHTDRGAGGRQGAGKLQPAGRLGTVTYLISPEFRKSASHQPAADSATKAAPSAASAMEADSIFSTTRAAASFFAEKAGERYPGKTYTTVFATTEVAQEADQFTLLSQSYFAQLTDHPDDSWLLAHELAHQWWGIAVTCADWSDFWLNEGIATFMADAFLEKQYGRARYEKEIEHSHQVYREALINGQDRPLSYHEWTRPAQAGGQLPYHKGAWFCTSFGSRPGMINFGAECVNILEQTGRDRWSATHFRPSLSGPAAAISKTCSMNTFIERFLGISIRPESLLVNIIK
jgi:aminopeptidase N